ncbi:hypothetical protein LWI29_035163 [Acer saccharum]|uniref:Uncharacterized protein n=1 Tax=Acer saccharum TaxID=4024 RepID=A0AA39W7M5_ACESA|nr:hypothetical protein LWI29_035163 [Acer saccharum]
MEITSHHHLNPPKSPATTLHAPIFFSRGDRTQPKQLLPPSISLSLSSSISISFGGRRKWSSRSRSILI